MVLNSNQIQEILPHRFPFLLVDRIDELRIGQGAKGIKNVTINDYFFLGHFPSEHVMPGVLIIEALAQVGAVAILSSEEHRGKIVYFAGIKEAKFKRKVIPGDTLVLESNLTRVKGRIGISEAVAKVNGEIACECIIMFAIEN